jgi:hypothetical protein
MTTCPGATTFAASLTALGDRRDDVAARSYERQEERAERFGEHPARQARLGLARLGARRRVAAATRIFRNDAGGVDGRSFPARSGR